MNTMLKKAFVILTGLVCLLLPLTALADSSSGGYWEEVNFSINWENFDPSLAGQPFDWRDYNNAGDWLYGDQNFTLEVDLPENIQTADFSILLAGAGYVYPAEVYLNGEDLGSATVGDGSMLGENLIQLDTFSLSDTSIASLGDTNSLDISAFAGDGWALVGARLTGTHSVWHDGGGTAPVPEPATMLLFGTGLAGLAGAGVRKKKK